ncbi:hypothetical protein L208DRAFT_1374079 [Tricholoma matsutake]|nr:hypothetical protein L208DRAFT_1374079 [Tricholoma matsutake 945]
MSYLQNRQEIHLLNWVETSTGPSSEAVWTVTCKIADEVKGVGVGPQKAAAKQLAAKQALAAHVRPARICSGVYIFKPLILDNINTVTVDRERLADNVGLSKPTEIDAAKVGVDKKSDAKRD